MRLAVSAVGLALAALLLPAGAFGAEILYATASSKGRIDGFRLGGNQLAATPTVQAATQSNPRRILVVGCFLYVAEQDRVEAFRIRPGGGLTRWARTAIDATAKPSDLAVWPPPRTGEDPTHTGARMLYVAEPGLARALAYPLEADGLGEPAAEKRSACSCDTPADCNGAEGSCVEKRCTAGTSPTPCARGQTYVFESASCAVGSVRFQSLAVHRSRVYVGGAAFFGAQVDGFKLDAHGNLLDARTDALAETCAASSSDAGACSCTGPADCDASAGSCVSGRCVGGTRVCKAHPDCAAKQTCDPGAVCSCDKVDDCDSSDGSCTDGLCRRSSGEATRTCDPAKATDTTPACPTGQRCLLDRRPMPEWCIRRTHGSRLAIDAIDPQGNHVLYVTDRLFGRILGFANPVGVFDGPDFPAGGALRNLEDPKSPCSKGAACACSNKKAFRPKKLGVIRTAAVAPYETLFAFSPAESSAEGAFLPFTLFGSEFQRGRVDAYNQRRAGTAPRAIGKRPVRSGEDVRMSPVGMAASDDVLYAAGGELDRIRAYRMRRRADGSLAELALKTQTDEQAGSFPNDVALAIPSTCPALPE